jgi:hypothetical protein
MPILTVPRDVQLDCNYHKPRFDSLHFLVVFLDHSDFIGDNFGSELLSGLVVIICTGVGGGITWANKPCVNCVFL